MVASSDWLLEIEATDRLQPLSVSACILYGVCIEWCVCVGGGGGGGERERGIATIMQLTIATGHKIDTVRSFTMLALCPPYWIILNSTGKCIQDLCYDR